MYLLIHHHHNYTLPCTLVQYDTVTYIAWMYWSVHHTKYTTIHHHHHCAYYSSWNCHIPAIWYFQVTLFTCCWVYWSTGCTCSNLPFIIVIVHATLPGNVIHWVVVLLNCFGRMGVLVMISIPSLDLHMTVITNHFTAVVVIPVIIIMVVVVIMHMSTITSCCDIQCDTYLMKELSFHATINHYHHIFLIPWHWLYHAYMTVICLPEYVL